MTIEIIPIAGRPDSACRNDAWSIVQKIADGTPRVLDILPLHELGGCTPATLRTAFRRAIAIAGEDDPSRVRREARRQLRQYGFPVTPR